MSLFVKGFQIETQISIKYIVQGIRHLARSYRRWIKHEILESLKDIGLEGSNTPSCHTGPDPVSSVFQLTITYKNH